MVKSTIFGSFFALATAVVGSTAPRPDGVGPAEESHRVVRLAVRRSHDHYLDQSTFCMYSICLYIYIYIQYA